MIYLGSYPIGMQRNDDVWSQYSAASDQPLDGCVADLELRGGRSDPGCLLYERFVGRLLLDGRVCNLAR